MQFSIRTLMAGVTIYVVVVAALNQGFDRVLLPLLPAMCLSLAAVAAVVLRGRKQAFWLGFVTAGISFHLLALTLNRPGSREYVRYAVTWMVIATFGGWLARYLARPREAEPHKPASSKPNMEPGNLDGVGPDAAQHEESWAESVERVDSLPRG